MDTKPVISEAEWKVMKILWRKSPQPAYDIAQALSHTEDWDPRTVKTLLSRLVKKKVLAFEPYKNLYLYRPLMAEEECVRAKVRSFVDQVCDGSLATMLVHFTSQAKLSKEEVRELKELINKMEE